MDIRWSRPLMLHTVLKPRRGTGRYRLADDWPPKIWHALNLAAYMAQQTDSGRWDDAFTVVCAYCGAAAVLDNGEPCPYCGRAVSTDDR